MNLRCNKYIFITSLQPNSCHPAKEAVKAEPSDPWDAWQSSEMEPQGDFRLFFFTHSKLASYSILY